ncbi:MAG: hypothetical protein RBT75_20295, partial [Anaerolineae bacterium]|nr:hypothetical protein [Anaerolineae bacterium]
MKTRTLWLNVILLLVLLMPGVEQPMVMALPENSRLAAAPQTTDGPPRPPFSAPLTVSGAQVSANLTTAPLNA